MNKDKPSIEANQFAKQEKDPQKNSPSNKYINDNINN